MIFPVKKQIYIQPRHQRLAWYKNFKENLYKRNFLEYFEPQENENLEEKDEERTTYQERERKCRKIQEQQFLGKQDQLNLAAEQLLITLRTNVEKLCQKQTSNSKSSPYNLNSVYIPIISNISYDDELKNTFLYLRTLQQQNKQEELDYIYEEIQKKMSECKKVDENNLKQGKVSNCVESFWKKSKKMLIPNIDVINAIKLYVEFTKYGCITTFFDLIRKQSDKYGPVFPEIIISKICRASKYFRNNYKYNRSLKISIESSDTINMINMAKTMKQLYCSVCMIYDCGKHVLSEECINKMFNYYSLDNRRSDEDKYESAFQLCLFYQKLKNSSYCEENSGEDCFRENQVFEGRDRGVVSVCGPHCYKELNMDKFREISVIKSRLLSPINIGLITMGIQIYSFEPCFISVLFKGEKSLPTTHQISCSIIFAYLIQQKNLQSILQHKLHSSELLNLLKQPQYLTRQPIQILLPEETYQKYSKKSLNKHQSVKMRNRKNKKEYEEQLKFKENSVCYHHFIGEEENGSVNCKEGECSCKARGFCLPQCNCSSDCPIMIVGCICKSREDCKSVKCPCYKNRNECIPGICGNCFSFPKKNRCTNDQILRGKRKLILVGPSTVPDAGLGAFAGQSIQINSLITVYNGEIISEDILSIREKIKKSPQLYGFGSIQGCLDARFVGNKSRFINHGSELEGKTNVESRNVYSNAQQYIALYAQRDIQQGEQLFFDYDVEKINDRNFQISFFNQE